MYNIFICIYIIYIYICTQIALTQKTMEKPCSMPRVNS